MLLTGVQLCLGIVSLASLPLYKCDQLRSVRNGKWWNSGLRQGDIMGPLRNVMREYWRRWPEGVVPVEISRSFSYVEISKIKRGMQHIQEWTCIKFRPVSPEDRDYISVDGTQNGCWSSVGKTGGKQLMNLQFRGCSRMGTIIHEFLHCLGLHHQQASANRDYYVEIHMENIQPGKEDNFKKYTEAEVTDYNLPYDYHSIMHYPKRAFSKNGLETITPLGGRNIVDLGQRKEMSSIDIEKIIRLYQCRTRSKSFSQLSGVWFAPDFHNIMSVDQLNKPHHVVPLKHNVDSNLTSFRKFVLPGKRKRYYHQAL